MSSNKQLRPGKGSHQTLTPDLLSWMAETINHVNEYWPTEQELDAHGGTMTRKQAGELLQTIAKSMNGWEVTTDSFGLKVYRYYPWQGGEFRIGLVRPKPGSGDGPESNVDLRIDVRFWYDPDA